MVVKRFFINISMLFFGALLLQAKNIIARDMGANKGDVPANIAILDSDSSVVAKNMPSLFSSTPSRQSSTGMMACVRAA